MIRRHVTDPAFDGWDRFDWLNDAKDTYTWLLRAGYRSHASQMVAAAPERWMPVFDQPIPDSPPGSLESMEP